MTAPAAPTAEVVADIKQHVSQEMHSAVQKIQGSIQDEHKQISDKLITPESVSSLIQRAVAGTREPRAFLGNYVLKGHPAWAAGLSALMIAFTEARDWLAWVYAGPISDFVKPVLPAALPVFPKSMDEVPRFVTDWSHYVQMLAATTPNEWMFRIRAAAIALLAYALYRLLGRRHSTKAIEMELAKAQQTVKELQSAGK